MVWIFHVSFIHWSSTDFRNTPTFYLPEKKKLCEYLTGKFCGHILFYFTWTQEWNLCVSGHCMSILCRTPRLRFIIDVEFYTSKWYSYKEHLQYHNLKRSSLSKENKNKASTVKKDWLEFSQSSSAVQFVIFVCFKEVPLDIYLLKSVTTSSGGTGSLQQYMKLLSTTDFSILFCWYSPTVPVNATGTC